MEENDSGKPQEVASSDNPGSEAHPADIDLDAFQERAADVGAGPVPVPTPAKSDRKPWHGICPHCKSDPFIPMGRIQQCKTLGNAVAAVYVIFCVSCRYVMECIFMGLEGQEGRIHTPGGGRPV